MIGEDFLWTEKYRPKTVDDCVLPERIKEVFRGFISQGSITHLLLTGTAGVGKTTIAKAVCNELGCDILFVNASMNRNIDTLRNEISQFASSMSLTGKQKVVILDEADHLNPQSTQPALRAFMEEFSNNCVFILTCNFKNKIIEPIHSRCVTVEFKLDKKEIALMASQFLKRSIKVLDENQIEYDKKIVSEIVAKFLPDWRKVLNELQRASVSGKIDPTALHSFSDDSFKNLIDFMKEKKFSEVRKWVTENSDVESATLFRKLYDYASTMMTPSSIPGFIVTLARYQYQEAFVADKVINTSAMFAEMMADTIWVS